MPVFEKTVDVEFEFEVYCSRCGGGLCHGTITGTTPRRDMPFVRVDPCETCMENKYEEGREEAKSE